MGFRDKKKDQVASNEVTETADSERTHSLAETALDAGQIDVAPATASVEIVREEPRAAVSVDTPAAGTPLTRRTNYSRREWCWRTKKRFIKPSSR